LGTNANEWLMKTNRAAVLYWLLIIGALVFHALSKPHSFLKEGYWQATLATADKQVPFNLEVRGTSPENTKVFLLTGGQRLELTNIDQRQDTLLLALEPYHLFIKARIEKKRLTGEATPLPGSTFAKAMTFRAEYGSKHPDESTSMETMTEKGAAVAGFASFP
jgi:hypothetical protein